MSEVRLRVKAGTYHLGDPCYTVPGDRWMEWLNAADFESNHAVLDAELGGHRVIGLSTAYGDGTYRGSDGFIYGVDAGLIGLVPVDLPGIRDDLPDLTTKVAFHEDFDVVRDSNGTLTFGHIVIETGDVEDDE